MPLEKGFVAGGTIRPMRFVELSGDSTVVESGVGGQPFGISQEYSTDVPIAAIPGSGINAATIGQQVRVYGDADAPVLLTVGAGGWSAGNSLKPDASGAGIPAALPTDDTGAIALEDGLAGQFIRVQVNNNANN